MITQNKEAAALLNLPGDAIDGLAKAILAATPDTNAASAQAQRERGAALIKNLALGGAALGGGVSAAVVLANYLKSLRQESEMEDESRLNDDTLYVSKMAADNLPNRWLAPGLAVTGGVLAAGGTYALVQALYAKMRKRQLEELLDEAQAETVALADAEADAVKSAATSGMSTSDVITALPVALPILLALAAAGVTHHSLSKAFPTVKKPKSNFPKRIRMAARKGDESAVTDAAEAEEAVEKIASFNPEREQEIERAAQEYLLVITNQLSDQTKSATITADIIRRVAEEGTIGVTQAYMEGGLEAMAECVKSASFEPLDEATKCAAAFAIARNPYLAPAVSVLAGSELLDMLPVTSFILEKSGSAQADAMAGIGALMGVIECRPQVWAWFQKSAMMQSALLEEILANAENEKEIPEDLDIESNDDQATLREPTTDDAENGDALSDPEILARDEALLSDQGGSMGDDYEAQNEDGLNPTEAREDERDLVEDLIEDEAALERTPPEG